MRGISPLLAAVLLISVTVVIATLYAGWYSSLIGGQTKMIENKTRQSIDCTAARISILDVYMDFANNISRVNVRNSGQVDDTIISANIYNSFGINGTNLSALPTALNKGNILSLEFNITGVIPACGNFSKAFIASQCKTDSFTSTPKGC